MQMDNIKTLYKFTYNEDTTYSANFNEWCYLNRKERELFGDELLSIAEAKTKFDAQYGARNTGSMGSGV